MSSLHNHTFTYQITIVLEWDVQFLQRMQGCSKGSKYIDIQWNIVLAILVSQVTGCSIECRAVAKNRCTKSRWSGGQMSIQSSAEWYHYWLVVLPSVLNLPCAKINGEVGYMGGICDCQANSLQCYRVREHGEYSIEHITISLDYSIACTLPSWQISASRAYAKIRLSTTCLRVKLLIYMGSGWLL